MFLGALSGFTVGVTSDRRAEEQSELLVRRGAEVVAAPVIRTLPLSDERLIEAATTSLTAEPPDIVVFSTALGVRGWCSGAEGLGLLDRLREVFGDATVIARGPKAAGAALTYGIEVDWVTPNATYAEVVAHLEATLSESGSSTRRPRVALQLDGELASGLPDILRRVGYDVVPVPVYEWRLPDDIAPAERLVGAAAERALDAVTFTSAHAVTNFGLIAERLGLLADVVDAVDSGSLSIVCVGPVTAARARSIGFAQCVEPTHPRLGAMVQALVVAFADRAVTVDLHGTQILLQGRYVSADGGTPVRLSDRERALLEVLARRPGAVVSKRSLLDEVWAGESDDHVVEVTVARLRRRLGTAGDGIETVVRRGYRLSAS